MGAWPLYIYEHTGGDKQRSVLGTCMYSVPSLYTCDALEHVAKIKPLSHPIKLDHLELPSPFKPTSAVNPFLVQQVLGSLALKAMRGSAETMYAPQVCTAAAVSQYAAAAAVIRRTGHGVGRVLYLLSDS